MVAIKVCLLVLLAISFVAGYERKADRRLFARRNFLDLEDDDSQEYKMARRGRPNNVLDQLADSDEISAARREKYDSDSEEEDLKVRRDNKHNSDKDELSARRREQYNSDSDEEDLEERASGANAAPGFTLTIENHAAMSVRGRILFINGAGNPAEAETPTLLANQKGELTIPADAKNIQVFIDKDKIAGHFTNIYKGTMTAKDECLRVVGTLVKSAIHPCGDAQSKS